MFQIKIQKKIEHRSSSGCVGCEEQEETWTVVRVLIPMRGRGARD